MSWFFFLRLPCRRLRCRDADCGQGLPALSDRWTTERERMKDAGQDQGLSLIDCDVHCVPVQAEEIVERLPTYFRTQGLVLPGGPGLPHPTGVRRVDAR